MADTAQNAAAGLLTIRESMSPGRCSIMSHHECHARREICSLPRGCWLQGAGVEFPHGLPSCAAHAECWPPTKNTTHVRLSAQFLHHVSPRVRSWRSRDRCCCQDGRAWQRTNRFGLVLPQNHTLGRVLTVPIGLQVALAHSPTKLARPPLALDAPTRQLAPPEPVAR